MTETEVIEPAENISLSTVASQREEAAWSQIIAHAQRNPRNLKLCIDEAVTLVTMDQYSAEECFYAIPRDGKTISGPSVRMAEILQSSFQYMVVDAWIVAVEHNVVRVGAAATDLQKLTRVSAEVSRSILTRDRRRFSPDMIQTTTQAALAIARRNAILSLIPRPLVRRVIDAAEQAAAGGDGTHVEKVAAAINYLTNEANVELERILEALNVPSVDNILASGLVIMRRAVRQVERGEDSYDRLFPRIGESHADPSSTAANAEADIARAKEAAEAAKPKTKKPKRPDPVATKARLIDAAAGRLIADGEATEGDKTLDQLAENLLLAALGLAGFTTVDELPDEKTVTSLVEVILTGSL